ncbi:MAG TPA: hypothetical protein VF824_20800 [Thermoanaerobaculia bacterium]|jgi:hypothetical protein
MNDGEPAQIRVDGDRVVVQHARFDASIDPFTRAISVDCSDDDRPFADAIVERTALSCFLPLAGGLLLHSAGVVIGGRAVAFYGRSGAGKSTFASLVDAPLLSDELIAIERRGDAFVARASGFWGELESRAATAGSFPLHALVELGRGDDVALEPLNAREAMRALVAVAVVPPHPALWRAVMPIIEALAKLRALRLRWTPTADAARRVLAHFQ